LSFLKRLFKKEQKRIVVGYWNGVCPHCRSHVGIDVLVDGKTGKNVAVCPVCKAVIEEKDRT
jgi:hypothetical protein